MTNRCCALLIVTLLVGSQAFALGQELIKADNGEQLAAAFAAGEERWQLEKEAYGQQGTGAWQHAVAQPLDTADYEVQTTFTIVTPADRRDGLEMGAYAVYSAHANLGGYENALCVRYEGPEKHYRIAVSSLWKEIIVWRPSGGVVQAVEFPFEVGKTYVLKAICRGSRMTIAIDGKQVIDWFDTAEPLLKGTVALAVKEGRSTWGSLTVTKQLPLEEVAAPHRPAFSEREWHGGRWFFDGNEPLCTLRETNILDHMKLMPKYRAAMYAFNFVSDWSRFYPTKITSYRLLEKGERLVIETVAIDPKSTAITCTAVLTVIYDPKSGMYTYDHACSINLPNAEEAGRVSREWDHGDAVFLGSVGTAQTRGPNPAKPLYLWSLFETPDQTLFKVPHNHNGHYLAKESNNGGPIYPSGGRVIAVGNDSILSPTIQIVEKRPEFSKCKVGLCWWAYDVHTLFEPELKDGVLQPGVYTSKVRYSGLPAAQGQELLARAELYKPVNPDVRVPVFTAGIGDIEPFDKEVLLASPHTEHRIVGGRIDRQQGHGDAASLCLDGASQCWTLTGPSYFVAPYGKRNRVSVWVKMKDVESDGPTIGFRRLDNNTAEFHPLGVSGTQDWTKVSYVTDFPQDSYGVMVYFRNSGRGTVWFDDFQIEPIDAAADAPTPTPANDNQSDVVLDYRIQHSDTLFDASGHRHHAKVYGKAKCIQEEGQTALVLDGETTYVWPLGSPKLAMGPGMTLLTDIKPAGAGIVAAVGFHSILSLTGSGEELAVQYQLASGAVVQSKPLLKTGQWQQLGVVIQKDGLEVFVDGKFAEKLSITPVKADWALHEQTTWHRHLSFFGMGPGNLSLIEEPTENCLRGEVRSLTILGRELSHEEISGHSEAKP